MSFDVFLEVVLASEGFLANWTREGPESGVDPSMAGELFVSGEGFPASVVFASERSLAGVDSDVAFELSVV